MQNFDPDKLIEQWWGASISPLTQECEDWIEKSYGDSKPFWESLFSLHQKSRRAPLQSVLGSQYDFYHDCILRHIQSNDLAFTFIKKESTENWAYKQLHRCVNYHIRKWSKYDPQPGQTIAIALSTGIEYVIALLTSLRLGLKICYLPSSPYLGNSLIVKTLAAIKPQYLVTEEGKDFGQKEVPQLLIDPKGQEDENLAPLSFPYRSAAIAQISLALYRQEPLAFVPLDANTLYLHAMRDALVSFNLRENTSWAAPLTCPIRTEPCSTLITLLAGARKVQVADSVIQSNPEIIKDEKIHLVGISTPMQQLWSRTPAVPTRYLKACYKNPMDLNYQGWKSFTLMNKIEKIPGFQLLMDNSIGGISLLSIPNLENADFLLRPSLGTTWTLDDIGGKPFPSTYGYGYFHPQLTCKDNTKKASALPISQVGKRCIIAGSNKPCSDGITFPLNDLEGHVNRLPFVEICMLHPIPIAGQPMTNRFILLVFVDPMKSSIEKEKASWLQAVSRQIGEHLGTGFNPEQIEIFPLLPKMRGSEVDRNWCARQYEEGLFTKKLEKESYKFLHTLKKLSLGSEALSIAHAK